MLNFRNVVIGGPSTPQSSSESWPKLGDSVWKSSDLYDPALPVNPEKSLEGSEATEFPELNWGVFLTARNAFRAPNFDRGPSKPPGNVKKSKRARYTGPLQIDICEMIQACAIKKLQKADISKLKKSTKIRRKIIGGNPLDSDQPKRHKGKVRPWKPRDLTTTKKIFCASRKVRPPKSYWPSGIMKFRTEFGTALKRGQIDVESLVATIEGIKLQDAKIEINLEGQNELKLELKDESKLERKDEPINELKSGLKNEPKLVLKDVPKLVPKDDDLKVESKVDQRDALKQNNSEVDSEALKVAKTIVHTKKFRSYCNNLLSEDLLTNTKQLVAKLCKFQDRMHNKDAVKAHAKRRYICGFNESKKFLLADRVKLLIVAADLEMEEGLPSMDILKRLIDAANEKNVPVVFAGSRKQISYWSYKKGSISVFAVMNYEGADEIHAKVIESWNAARSEYNKLIESIVERYSADAKASFDKETKKRVEEEFKAKILEKLKN